MQSSFANDEKGGKGADAGARRVVPPSTAMKRRARYAAPRSLTVQGWEGSRRRCPARRASFHSDETESVTCSPRSLTMKRAGTRPEWPVVNRTSLYCRIVIGKERRGAQAPLLPGF